jgi:polyhydroxyalkanoate synthesis repressor PhaR
MARKKSVGDEPITIKKYANRRLYNTATSSYVTLDDLALMVKDGNDFVVYDAKSGDDITRAVLTQIIVEEEAKGQNLLPIRFLRQLIAFYGDSLQSLVPRYLDHSMDSFAGNQDQMRTYLQSAFDGTFPFGSIEEMSKQNAAYFEQAMKMFSPADAGGGSSGGDQEGGEPERGEPDAAEPAPAPAPDTPAPDTAAENAGAESLADIKDKIDALQRQLEALTAKRPD